MNKNRSKLPAQAVKLFQKVQGKSNIFTREDAARALNIKPNYLNILLHRLEEMGWIMRLEREKYLIIPIEAGRNGSWTEHPFVIASYLVDPYAIAYWSALSHWDYTEQLLKTTFVLTTKQKFNRSRQILGETYRFIRIPEKKFFGVMLVWVGDYNVMVTDRERTLIDCLDHPEYCGGMSEVAKGLREAFEEKKLSTHKLLDYAERIGNRTVFKRLGYLLEILDLDFPEVEKQCLKRISRGYSKLDPTMPIKGKYNAKWNLIENVAISDLRTD
jgi:predicted transcriptional regulator of viral defense system